LGIIHKRKGNACEKCKKLDTEVGEITHYTGHSADLLLCAKCLKKREEPYTEICPKCKENAYDNGGMTVGDSDEPPFEEMCMKCYEKDAKRKEQLRKTKKIVKTNWYRLVVIGLSITAIIVTAVIGLSR